MYKSNQVRVLVEQIKKYIFQKKKAISIYKLSSDGVKKIGLFLERGISCRANSTTGYKNLAHF